MIRSIARWLPAVILAVVASGAVAAMLAVDRPPDAADGVRSASSGLTATPVLSPRRLLDPLVDAAADRRLVARLDEFVAAQPADTCLVVRTATIDYAHRADDPQSPASVQKLLTAVTALTELGPEATFETAALAARDGATVPGNLYLRGGGDPILAIAPYVARERNQPQIYSDLAALADAVVAAGVTQIGGSVVGDETRHDQVRYNPFWPDRFVAQGVVGPLSALSVNDGFAYFPDAGGAFGASADPAAYAATLFDRLLRERGVTIGGVPASGPTPAGQDPVASHRSPPVADIVTQLLRESDNNTAELLLKELGVEDGNGGNFPAGREAVTESLGELGFDVGAITVADGSGLAMEDQVTCEVVVDVLDHEPTAEQLRASLAVAGESGTLARRWVGTELAGRVVAKTGTLNQVTSLAGRAVTAGGPDARFALIVNVPETERIQLETVAAQETLASILIAHPDRPDVDALRPSGAPG